MKYKQQIDREWKINIKKWDKEKIKEIHEKEYCEILGYECKREFDKITRTFRNKCHFRRVICYCLVGRITKNLLSFERIISGCCSFDV